jgi:glutamine---fructose-6-phosphate transaminase (isomerizing)
VADGTTPLLVAVSRSGETSETVLATRRFRERRLGSVLVLTARAESSLGREGDLTLALPWADDQSVVMTRSFTTLLLAAWSLAAAVAGDRALQSELEQLPSLCGAAIEEAWPLAARLGEAKEWDHFIYLGMGAYGGLALEGMLKLKEMTRVPCEAYAPLEFRHGPISVVTERTTAILLCQEAGAPYHGSLLADIRKEGGRTVAVGHPVDGLPADHLLPLGEGLSDRSRGLLYMPLLQLFALQRALTLGLNPDQPQKLARVVRLDG